MSLPSDDQLRWAGAELQLAQIQAEINQAQAELERTWRGRLALRLGKLISRWRAARS